MRFCIFFLFNRADDDHHFRGERYRSFQPTASGLRLDRQICRSSEIQRYGDLEAIRPRAAREFSAKGRLMPDSWKNSASGLLRPYRAVSSQRGRPQCPVNTGATDLERMGNDVDALTLGPEFSNSFNVYGRWSPSINASGLGLCYSFHSSFPA